MVPTNVSETETNSATRTTVSDRATPARLNVIAVLLLLLLFASAGQTFLNRRIPETWQYTVAAPKDLELKSVMDRMGAEGWELVFARRASDGDRVNPTMSYEMIFKKRGSSNDASVGSGKGEK